MIQLPHPKALVRHPKALALAALAFTILWFALLAGRPLYDPDEGRYAEIPREMLAGGDWVIPHLNGLVYLEKPPLQYWATALVYAGLGPSEWSARLVTGLAGYLGLLFVFATAYRLWGLDAGLTALLLTASSILYFLLGHQLTLDMTLSVCLLGCLCCFLLAQSQRDAPARGRAWMIGCWAAMALAVLTKGVIGVLIPGFSLLAYVLWQRDWKTLANLHWRLGAVLFALIALPWFVLAARADREFLWFFFVREHLQRFLTPIEERTQPWWFFIPVLIVGILPWITQATVALATGWRRARPRGEFDARRLLWIWSSFVLVFFSLSNSKLIPYILPAVPSLALLCAAPTSGTSGAAGLRRHLRAGAGLTALFALGALGYASALWSSPKGLALALILRPAVFGIWFVLAAGALLCLQYLARGRALAAQAALAGAWFAAGVALTLGACSAQSFYSAKDVAEQIGALQVGSAPVFTVQTYEQSLPFYLGRTVTLVDYHDEFALGERQDPARSIAGLAPFSTVWTALDKAYAIMPPATEARLAAAGLPMRVLERFPNAIVLVSRR